MGLDERKQNLLKSIINEYVEVPEPVSSGLLIAKYQIPFSSATIRNEMNELEKMGYLEKPYSSSGRVPSDKGYRYYVDRLINDERLDSEDIKKIKKSLEKRSNNLEELTKIATATLSEITHYTSIAISPDSSKEIINKVEFIRLGPDAIMVLVITLIGMVKETVIKFERIISEELLSEMRQLFKSKLEKKPLEIINTSIEEYIKAEVEIGSEIIEKVIEELNKTIFSEAIYVEGEINQFRFPELENVELREEFLDMMSNSERFIERMKEENEEGTISIKIAGEEDSLKNFSIITLTPNPEKHKIGKIAVIAPKRMDYKKVILAMRETLNELANNNSDASDNSAKLLKDLERIEESEEEEIIIINDNINDEDEKENKNHDKY